MRFLISRADNIMSIDNVGIALDCSSLPSTVKYVIYNENGSGFIEPAAGIPLRTAFTDPSPYQALINSWITAQAAATPAITLAQAQSVKSELIDAIWAVKRQANVSVTTSLGTYTFDASDAATSSTNGTSAILSVIAGVLAAINSSVSTGLTASIGNVNTEIGSIESQINSGMSAFSTVDASNVDAVNAALSTSLAHPPNWSVSAAAALASYSYTGPALTAPVKMLPVGATAYPAFTVADLFLVVAAVKAQHDNELLVRSQMQSALAALSTIAAVTAYDVTTGW